MAFSIACASQRASRVDDASTPMGSSCANGASVDTTVFTKNQVSKPPQVISGPDLRYPDELRQLGQSGRVVYSLIVNTDGAPDLQSIRVVSSDDLRFESAARDWLKQALFSPGCLNGQAVRVRITIPIDFKVRRDD